MITAETARALVRQAKERKELEQKDRERVAELLRSIDIRVQIDAQQGAEEAEYRLPPDFYEELGANVAPNFRSALLKKTLEELGFICSFRDLYEERQFVDTALILVISWANKS